VKDEYDFSKMKLRKNPYAAKLKKPVSEYRRVAAQRPLAERLGAIADELAVIAKPSGQDMTKDEINAMWDHP